MKCLSDYLEKNYEELVRYASSFTNDPKDLVHHTYIRIHDSPFIFLSEPQTDTYFKRSIKMNGIHGFAKLYAITEEEVENIAEEFDVDRRICLERLDEVVRGLDEFDRMVFDRYLLNDNIAELAKGSGVPISTLYHSLSRVRKLIKQVI